MRRIPPRLCRAPQFTEDGFYLQGLYGIAPRWQVGLRYDKVGLTNELESGGSLLRDEG